VSSDTGTGNHVIEVTAEMINSLTVGELELLEERTGRSINQMWADGAPKGTLMRTLAFISMRRANPATTWEETADMRVRLEQQDEEAGAAAVNPTAADGTSPPSPSVS
jgi:hypothetical protein